jgi:starch synthase
MIRDDSKQHPRLLWITPEFAPYATAGGLGEVVSALAHELHAADWPLAVLLPRYRSIDVEESPDVLQQHPLTLQLGHHRYHLAVHEAKTRRGLTLFLLDCPALFDRDGIYGPTPADTYADNHLRFGVLNLVACELVRSGVWPAEILHVHDWPASLSLAMLATWYREVPELANLRTILSIHNLAHPGGFDTGFLDDVGLPRGLALPELMGYGGGISWLKGAIRFADGLCTVSPTYAREILTKEHGCGLDDALRERRRAVRGILNGIDTSEWDPMADSRLAAPYSAGALTGKARCKAALQREFSLERSDAPLLIFVGRLVEQKGVDLMLAALPALLKKGVQFVVSGSGQRELERGLLSLAAEHPGSVGVHVGFDRALVHRLVAGGDILLMPSRFEPCGITQMQAMRYGTVPVVHGVGGLRDTITPITPAGLAKGKGNGFVFRSFTSRALATCVGRALDLFAEPKRWKSVMRRGMESDWGWETLRPQYEELLTRAMKIPVRRFEIEIPRLLPAEPEAQEPMYIDWGPDLPPRYHEDVLRLMLQSPRQLYVYWELSSLRWQSAQEPVSLELVGEGGQTTLVAAVADVGDWWLTVLPDHEYRVVLRDASGEVLLFSNRIRTPREQESLRRDVRWVESEERRLRWAAQAGSQLPATSDARRYPRWKPREGSS